MGSQSFHMSLSTRGALRWLKPLKRRMAKGMGKTVEAFEEWLMDALAAGFEVIPMAGCDNHDPKNGCRGHREPDEPRHQEGGE